MCVGFKYFLFVQQDRWSYDFRPHHCLRIHCRPKVEIQKDTKTIKDIQKGYIKTFKSISSKMPLRTSLHRKTSSGQWPSRNSRRREVLSVNMISLPLADFRHITHIGNDVHTDSFGDLSFLKMGHNLLLQSSQSEQNLFLACSPPPKPPRLNLDEVEGSGSPDWHVGHQNKVSQKRNKCNSMPLLDDEEGDGEMEKEDGYQRGNNVASSQTHSPRWGSLTSDKDADSRDTCDKTAGQQKDEDSGFSFSIDLGPSILDDVLQVMDKLHN